LPTDVSIKLWKTTQPQAGYPNWWSCWRTPDIFVDNNGNRIALSDPTVPGFKYYQNVDLSGEPTKGVSDNRLFTVVRNLGSPAANNVKVSFSYAPYGFVGGTLYQHVHFKPIAEVLVDLGAAGSPDAEKEVEVPWDLGDLSENNGGLWPAPISYFNHFCIRVTTEHPSGNKQTQHNFVNVMGTSPFAPLSTVIVNNDKKEARYELVAPNLPQRWRLHVRGLGEKSLQISSRSGAPFILRPGEERFVTLTLVAGEEERVQQSVEVTLLRERRPVGGISFLATKGMKELPLAQRRITYLPRFALAYSKPVRFPKE